MDNPEHQILTISAETSQNKTSLRYVWNMRLSLMIFINFIVSELLWLGGEGGQGGEGEGDVELHSQGRCQGVGGMKKPHFSVKPITRLDNL